MKNNIFRYRGAPSADTLRECLRIYSRLTEFNLQNQEEIDSLAEFLNVVKNEGLPAVRQQLAELE